MRYLLLIIVVLTMTSLSTAEEVLLVKTRNDINERDDRLYLELDEQGEPIELVHRVYDMVMGVYRLGDLTSGVALREYRGKAVLKLKIANFDPKTGGNASLTFLKSVVPSPRYGVIKFDLRRHLGEWRLFRFGDERPIKLLSFQANFSNILGIPQPTGIRRVRFLHDRTKAK